MSGGAREVVRALEAEGIDLAFGIPGTHNLELYDALASSRTVRAVLVTDEQSASFMADGAWRASGRMACVNLVPGAGLTHALSGIAEAYLDGVPLLVLACGVRGDTGRAYQLHDVDQTAIARPVVKAALRPRSAEEIVPAVRRAAAIARAAPPGPALVEVPAELYLLRGGGAPERGGFPTPSETTGRREVADGSGTPGTVGQEWPEADLPGGPAPQEVERVAAHLRSGRRPLLYLGLGAAGAGPHLVELAERLEAPVATTLSGKGVFPETHPLALWPGLGRVAPPFVRRIAAERDVTLAIGCRFAEVGTGSWSFTPPGELLHVDADPAVPGRNFPAALAIRADAARFVERLLPRLPPREADAHLRKAIRAGREAARRQAEAAGESGVNPSRLLRRLQEVLGPETVFATDSGNGTFLAAEGLELEGPGRFLAPVDYSCMGYAVPAAIGAALACPGTPVVALPGDGAFLMTGLELLTAARERTAVAVFVLRDRRLAQIAQFQDVALRRRSCSELAEYDLAALCRGVGVECLELSTDEEIDRLLPRVVESLFGGRPVAVDVAVDYSRRTWFTRGVVRTTFGRLPWPDRLRFLARAAARRLTG